MRANQRVAHVAPEWSESGITASKVKLYTYTASQASEKIRWTLDIAEIPYEEIRLTPFVHSGELFRSIPVLEANGESISDSTRILNWLEVNRAPFPLVPRHDPAARADVMDAEARFDHAGIHLLRLVYSGLLRDRTLALRLWSTDANILQRLVLHSGFPVIRRLFERGVGFDERQLARSRHIVDRTLFELDRLARSGREFLVGTSVSAADITAAALFAPLACPDEHPLYSCPDYQNSMNAVLLPWQDRPGIHWVKALYRKYRRATLMARGAEVTVAAVV